jgi:hypothetical protein
MHQLDEITLSSHIHESYYMKESPMAPQLCEVHIRYILLNQMKRYIQSK